MRNAARVLPVPVGAEMRTSLPAWIRGQPSAWGSLTCGNRLENHSATRGSSEARTRSVDILLGYDNRYLARFFAGSAQKSVEMPGTGPNPGNLDTAGKNARATLKILGSA